MPTLTTRLTPEGILLTNAYFDEITKTWISITPTAVYAGLFDEVFLAAGSITFAGSGDYLSGTVLFLILGPVALLGHLKLGYIHKHLAEFLVSAMVHNTDKV